MSANVPTHRDPEGEDQPQARRAHDRLQEPVLRNDEVEDRTDGHDGNPGCPDGLEGAHVVS